MLRSHDVETASSGRPDEGTPLISSPLPRHHQSPIQAFFSKTSKQQRQHYANNNNNNNNKSIDMSPAQQMAVFKEYAVMAWAGLTFCSSLYSLIMYSYPTIILASIVGVVLSPYALVQQNKLTQIVALKEINASLGGQINTLQAENDLLLSSVDDLEDHVKELSLMQQTLTQLQGVHGNSLAELESQLQASRDILARLDSNVQTDLMQNIITLMLAGDTDRDMLLSDEEIDKLIQNLKDIHGVDIKDDLLRQVVIDNGRSIRSLVEVARHAMTSEVPPQQNIFSIIQQGYHEQEKA